MASNTLLDVDDTILTNNLLLPGNDIEREMNDMLKEFETKSKYIVIHPSPGCCLKVRLDTGEKVFVNVCVSTKVPPPEDITEEKLLSLYDEENPAFTIPMSISEERLEVDKGGASCITHDVIINEDYLKKCQTVPSFWVFTVSSIMAGISYKFNRSLDMKTCILLKNRKVMGTLRPQRVEDREARKTLPQPRKPLIQEISSSSKTISDSITTPVQLQNNYEETNTCKYVILKEPSEGVTNSLIGLFEIPKGISSKNLIVLVDPVRLVITTNENKFAYDICVPYTMKTDEVKSFFDKDLRVLRVNIPVYNK